MSKMSNMSRLWGGKKGKAKETTCGFCRQPLLKDKTHSGNFYSVSALAEEEGGGKIHTECWEAYHEKTAVKCLHCQGPVAHLPGRYNGKYFKNDDPPGQVHSECWDAYNSAKPAKEKCGQCSEPLGVLEGKFSGSFVQLEGGTKVHVECRSAYHAANTEKCLQCSEPVAPEKGKFSGEFYELEGKGRVHSECYEEYADATAEKCIVCTQGIQKKGRFCGEFCIFSEGKVHKECASEHQEKIADKCLQCGKGVRKTGDFSGSYYPVERKAQESAEDDDAKEQKVHLECWEAYEAKIAADREEAKIAADLEAAKIAAEHEKAAT